MKHTVCIGEGEPLTSFASLDRGSLFHLPGRYSDSNIYMKVSHSQAFAIKTGEVYSNDENRPVVLLKAGTTISIIVGT